MAAPTKLKIGFVLDSGLDKPDGVQQYVLALGAWLQQQGHDVHYLVGETHRPDLPNVHSLSRNFHVTSNGNRGAIPLPTNRAKLRKFLAAEQFDVLHVQVPYSPFMGEQLVLLAGPRTAVVGTFHILPNSRFINWGTKLLGLWCRHSLRRFDAMLSVSPAAREFAQASFGVTSTVLPNVVDYPRFHEARPLPHYDDDTLTILFLGRLVERKGCLTLLQALARLEAVSRGQSLPPYRVVICGTGPLESKLKAYVSQHHLDQLVAFVGFVTEADKPRYYASADIAVFPSLGGESFGIVLLEAMASGRAVVLAGDNPGYRSVMADQPHLLFDPRQPDELAAKLRHCLTDATVRQQMQTWGAEYTTRFDIPVVGTELRNIYGQALQSRRQS